MRNLLYPTILLLSCLMKLHELCSTIEPLISSNHVRTITKSCIKSKRSIVTVSYVETYTTKGMWIFCLSVPDKCKKTRTSYRQQTRIVNVPTTFTFRECLPGYTLNTTTGLCAECISGVYGHNCSQSCTCRNGGKCDHIKGVCTCNRGFIGKSCETACPARTYGENCKLNCQCENGGKCNPADGSCTCISVYTGPKCDKGNLDCSFESSPGVSTLCGFVINSVPSYNRWNLHSGRTLTGNTGPTQDHTLQNNNGYYIYFESTSKKPGTNISYPQRTNYFSLPNQKPFNGSICLSFYLHLYKDGVVPLKNPDVFKVLQIIGGTEFMLLRYNTSLSNSWVQQNVDLFSTKGKNYEIKFQATAVSKMFVDVGVDDVSFFTMTCADVKRFIRVAPPPPQLMSVAVTNTTAKVSWLQPNTTTYPVIGYNVTLLIDNIVLYVNHSNTRLIKYSHLKPHHTYGVRISGYNKWKLYSKDAFGHFSTAEGVPTAVRNIVVSAKSSTEISIYWYKPEESNGIVSSYMIEYRQFNASKTFAVKYEVHQNIKEYSTVVQNLNTYTIYSLRIVARTDNGKISGPWSQWYQIKTLLKEIPPSYTLADEKRIKCGISYTNILINGKLLTRSQLKLLSGSLKTAVQTRVLRIFQDLTNYTKEVLPIKLIGTVARAVVVFQPEYSEEIINIKKQLLMYFKIHNYTLFPNTYVFQVTIDTTYLSVEDFDECSSLNTSFCDSSSSCLNLPDRLSYACKCADSYEGNGFKCTQKEKGASSTTYIVSGISAALLLVIISSLTFVCIRKKRKETDRKPNHVVGKSVGKTNIGISNELIYDDVRNGEYDDVQKGDYDDVRGVRLEMQEHYTGLSSMESQEDYAKLSEDSTYETY